MITVIVTSARQLREQKDEKAFVYEDIVGRDREYEADCMRRGVQKLPRTGNEICYDSG